MIDARKKLLDTCHRDAANEASLMWSWLFILFFVLVIISDVPSLFVAWPVHPYVYCGAIALGLSGLVSRLHFVFAADKISKAQIEYNELLERTSGRVRDEHIKTLTNRVENDRSQEED